MSTWFVNGEPASETSVGHRALQYGDGLFETIAIRGEEPRLWPLHRERMTSGCLRLGLALPDFEACRALITAYAAPTSTAKLIVAAAAPGRGYQRSDESADVFVGLFPAVVPQPDDYAKGIATMTCATRLASGSSVAGLKTLNRLEQVLARNELAGTDCFEGIVCNAAGEPICGTMSNLFIVRDGAYLTPALDDCGVAGVMRQHLLGCLIWAGRSVDVTVLQDLEDADEVFVTNSQFGLLPVTSCDELQWPVGPLTREAMRLLGENGVEECRL